MSFLRDSSWAFIAVWANQGLQVAASFVLAAVIGPEGFGLFAMAVVLINLMAMLVDQGLIVALIHEPELEDDHVHATFWAVVGLSLALGLLTAGLARPWAEAYGQPELEALLLVLAPIVAMKGLQVVPSALLRREARFRDYAAVNAVATGTASALAIGAVLMGAGIWALVLQIAATDILLVLMLWLKAGYRPAARFSWPHFRALLPVSSGAFAGSVARFVRMRADVLAIGFFLGPVAVGLFRLAGRLQELVLALTTNPVGSVLLTHSARHGRDADSAAVRETLRGALRLATSFAAVALGLLAGLAGPLLAVLGPDWDPARPALMVLAAAGLPGAVIVMVPPVLDAAGRSWLSAVWVAVTAAVAILGFVMVSLTVGGLDAAMQGLALGSVVLAVNLLVALPLGAAFVARVAPVGMADYLRPMLRALPLGLTGFAVPFGLELAGVGAGWPPLVRVAVFGAAGGLAVLALVLAAYPDLTRDYLRPALRRLGRLRRSG